MQTRLICSLNTCRNFSSVTTSRLVATTATRRRAAWPLEEAPEEVPSEASAAAEATSALYEGETASAVLLAGATAVSRMTWCKMHEREKKGPEKLGALKGR